MDELKVTRINIRISEFDKQVISEYCRSNGITISNFVREVCLDKINKNK